jgi:hypothetical protein
MALVLLAQSKESKIILIFNRKMAACQGEWG